MVTKTRIVNAANVALSGKRTAVEHAKEMLSSVECKTNWIKALFSAIKSAPKNHNYVQELAELGEYLAGDTSIDLDQVIDGLKKSSAIKEAK